MLRKGSSVAFRAPCSFGYKDVGGSSPSPSTNLSAGSSSGYRKLFQVSDHSLVQLGISRALRNGKQGNTIKLIVSKLLEVLGDVVGSNPAPRTKSRKGSSVVRAPCNLGYKEVGGSNPSPSPKWTACVIQPYL